MILVLKKDTRQEEMDNLITWLESQNVRTHISNGEYKTVVGLVGDTSALDIDLISGLDIVESVTRITEPFKKANRKFHPDDSIIQIADGVAMGGGHFQFIAGPCSVESPEQVMCIADAVKKSGAHLLRGGAFKPR
ncbi:MAG: 3-deoxy-7-phosphoheptulonate synthase, partial [Candidatus Fimadaptatus sp.]|nr:3-deoxy-7-phosphoheptulonate synthase [Candidatus Fimadaptatus sp.]